MKKYFIFLICISLLHFCSSAQNKASIDYQPLELEDGIIVVNALWAGATNPLKFYPGSKRSLWVRDGELDKWLKSYKNISGNNYLLINRSIQDNKVVLAKPEYINGMPNWLKSLSGCYLGL